MNALSLRALIVQELRAARIVGPGEISRLGHCRITRWSPKQPGFGVRCYASGKRVYIVQVRMDGVVRTVTICNAAFVSEAVALDVARRVILRAQVGENPAEDRKRIRSRPPFDRYLDRYWQQVAESWKPSTRRTHDIYRRQHLEGAFPGKTIDAIDLADVTRWHADIADSAGPGAANRTLAILSAMMSKAEEWGQRSPGSNPCRAVRRFRGRKMERILTRDEMGRIGLMLSRLLETRPAHAGALLLLFLTGCRLRRSSIFDGWRSGARD